jgi:hypothetical protein
LTPSGFPNHRSRGQDHVDGLDVCVYRNQIIGEVGVDVSRISLVELCRLVNREAPVAQRARQACSPAPRSSPRSRPDEQPQRRAGPFAVESLSPRRIVPAGQEELIDLVDAGAGARRRLHKVLPSSGFAEMAAEHLRTSGVHEGREARRDPKAPGSRAGRSAE